MQFSFLIQGGGGNWLKSWLWKGKNEAHLPDDKNKSVSSNCFICRSYFSIPLYSGGVFAQVLLMSLYTTNDGY